MKVFSSNRCPSHIPPNRSVMPASQASPEETVERFVMRLHLLARKVKLHEFVFWSFRHSRMLVRRLRRYPYPSR